MPPGRVDEDVRVLGQLAHEPGEIGDRAMREDQAGVGELTRVLHGVRPERGDAAPGMHEHDALALVRQRDELAHRRLAHPEPLGARVQLDPGRAAIHAAARLGDRSGLVRIDPRQRDEPAAGRRGLLEHGVVGRRVAAGLVHREDERAGADDLEGGEQLLGRLAERVRVVLAEVRVGVEERGPAGLVHEGFEPRAQDGVDVAGGGHGRTLVGRRGLTAQRRHGAPGQAEALGRRCLAVQP